MWEKMHACLTWMVWKNMAAPSAVWSAAHRSPRNGPCINSWVVNLLLSCPKPNNTLCWRVAALWKVFRSPAVSLGLFLRAVWSVAGQVRQPAHLHASSLKHGNAVLLRITPPVDTSVFNHSLLSILSVLALYFIIHSNICPPSSLLNAADSAM